MHPPSLLHQNPTCIISNLPSVVHDILLGGVATAWLQQLQMNRRLWLWWLTLILVQSTPGPFLFTFCSVSQFQIPFHLLFSVVTQSQTPSNFLFSCDTISYFFTFFSAVSQFQSTPPQASYAGYKLPGSVLWATKPVFLRSLCPNLTRWVQPASAKIVVEIWKRDVHSKFNCLDLNVTVANTFLAITRPLIQRLAVWSDYKLGSQ